MKILMAARRYPPDVYSGTETVFEALYAQARSRHEVRLVVGWRNDRSLIPPEAVGVNLREKSKPAGWMALSKALFSEIRRFRPDVVLSNSIEVPITGVPTACIVHDLNFGVVDVGHVGRLKKHFYATRARHLDAVIAVSHSSAQRLAEVGVAQDCLRVVHNGVDTEVFCPRKGEAPADEVHFVLPSRILPGKGQHHAIDAVARLPRAHKQRARLTLVGAVHDPVYLGQIRVQAYNQPVEFALDVPDMAPYVQRADVVLYPTEMEEGFGYTAIEGMACGKPVIWFDQPAVREATGGIGVAVESGNIDAMRAAMVGLMDDPKQRSSLGDDGRAYVVANLSWEQAWQRYEVILSAIAQ